MAFDFGKFSEKVLGAVKGRLSPKERDVLARLFSRTKKRNVVLAAGLLSALKVGGASKREIAEFAAILDKAHGRILEGKDPFTKKDGESVERIFRNANVPAGAEKKLRHNVQMDKDDLLASEIVNSITMGPAQRLKGFVPAKTMPSVRAEEEEERVKKQKRRVRG